MMQVIFCIIIMVQLFDFTDAGTAHAFFTASNKSPIFIFLYIVFSPDYDIDDKAFDCLDEDTLKNMFPEKVQTGRRLKFCKIYKAQL